MEMEHMLAHLLKEITDKIKEDMNANRKANQEEMRTNQGDCWQGGKPKWMPTRKG
jgi:hypothetical protein